MRFKHLDGKRNKIHENIDFSIFIRLFLPWFIILIALQSYYRKKLKSRLNSVECCYSDKHVEKHSLVSKAHCRAHSLWQRCQYGTMIDVTTFWAHFSVPSNYLKPLRIPKTNCSITSNDQIIFQLNHLKNI